MNQEQTINQCEKTPFSEFKEHYINAAFNWHNGCPNGRKGAENWFFYRGAFTEQLWDIIPESRRKLVIAELKNPRGWWMPTPYMFLRCFAQPSELHRCEFAQVYERDIVPIYSNLRPNGQSN